MSKSVSVVQGSILMVNTMFGVGVLYLPLIYYSVGLLQGLFLFLIVALLTVMTMYFLGAAAIEAKESAPTYYSTCTKAFRFMGPLADVSILLCCFFCCMAYLTFITDTIHFEIRQSVPKCIITITATLLVSTLAVQKDLSSLKIASLVSFSSVMYLSCFIVYIFTINHSNVKVKMINYDYASGLSRLLFALGCQHNMVSVYSQLKDKSRLGVLKVAFCATFFGGILYMAIGVFGYLGMGEAASSNILSLLTDNDSEIRNMLIDKHFLCKYAIIACNWMFVLTLCCSFAFQSHPARTSLTSLLRQFAGIKPEVVMSNRYRYVVTLVFSSLICALACLEIDVDIIVSFIGATCNNMMCYVMPALAFIGLAKNSRIRPLAYAVVALGFISMIYMVMINISSIIKKK